MCGLSQRPHYKPGHDRRSRMGLLAGSSDWLGRCLIVGLILTVNSHATHSSLPLLLRHNF